MSFPEHVFRAYDIRGIAGAELSPTFARALGRAVGTHVRRGGGDIVVVGRDCRPSGEELGAALARGLCDAGCRVLDIGVTPTPVGYWAIEHYDAHGGVQITGSHNPPEYNGFKLTLLGRSLHGQGLQELLALMRAGDFASGAGSVEVRAAIPAYLDDLVGRAQRARRRLRVVVDAGNGTAGLTAPPLYERLGYEVVPLYCDLDGTFPNHHPDPTVEENLADLIRVVRERSADVGLAFDGDGDRLGVVDAEGNIIWGDRLLIILARAVLAEAPGATILGEVKCSKTLYDDIAAHGGRPVMWKTGHSFIKAKMKEEQALLAGEMSGHIFFKHRYYGFDDATYAGARLLEVLSGSPRSLAELFADVPRTYATPELRVDCPEQLKAPLVEALRASFAARAAREGFRIIDIDGARIEWPDGWGLVRCSNTTPLLVLRFEAQSQRRLDEIRALVEGEVLRLRAGLRQ